MKFPHALRTLCWIAFTAVGPLAGNAAPPSDPGPMTPQPAAAAAEGTWVIGVVADNRGGTGTHLAILKKFKEANVDLIINLGDMLYPGPDGDWESMAKQYHDVFGEQANDWLARKMFVTVGGWEEEFINQHQKTKDAEGKEETEKQKKARKRRPGYEPDNAAGQEVYQRYLHYKKRAGKPGEFIREYTDLGDYYVKYRNLHLLSLYITDEWSVVKRKYHDRDDPEWRAKAIERQTVWLKNKLHAIRTAEPNAPIFVMAHRGTWHREGGALTGIVQALADEHVDVALCGDGHVYSYTKDPWTLKLMAPGAFSDGGDGYFLVRMTPSTGKIATDKITVEHYRFTGELKHTHVKFAGKPMETPEPIPAAKHEGK
ncbi:MAG: metallophosphoesterase [Planctomycetia bacterium]|nr:metallophosphoesterase [Planctomycetia bacterium]